MESSELTRLVKRLQYVEEFNIEADWPPERTSRRVYRLRQHPFGLQIPTPPGGYPDRQIVFLGIDGVTNISVGMMARELRNRWLPTIDYLRVILVTDDARFPDYHDVYFEVGIGNEVLICGGCTDFSGTGGRGKRQLDEIFTLIEEFRGIRHITATIPPSKAKKLVWDLAMEIDRIDQSKKRAS